MSTFSSAYEKAGEEDLQAQTGFNRRHARAVLEEDAQKGRKVISRPFPPHRCPRDRAVRGEAAAATSFRTAALLSAAARLLFAAARLLRKQQKQPKTRFRSERWDDAPLRRLRYAPRAAILVTRRRICKQPLLAAPLPIAHLLPEPFSRAQ